MPRAFFAVALLLGAAYAFLTPPFGVPDETLHFFRGEAIAGGHLIPNGGGKPDSAHVAQGVQTLVYVVTSGQPLTVARTIPLEPVKQPVVYFPAWYTPLPYAPQALAAAIGNALSVRPLAAFYAGRVANLIASLMLIALAMRIAPPLAPLFAAVALLPTALVELASWSADALTISFAFLLTAMLFADQSRSAVAAFLLGLCKPAYFLIALLRPRRIAVIVAAAAGTLLSFLYAHLAYYQQRGGVPIDASAQLRCIFGDPLHFARVIASDVASQWSTHITTMIGGATSVETALLIALLVAAGVTSVAPPRRALAAAIVVATILGIMLSQYLIWSIVCSDTLEGVQGRYFLPVLPLALSCFALPRVRWRLTMWPVLAIAAVANVVHLMAVASA